MSAYLGNIHPRDLHIQSVANDLTHSADLVSHSSQLATLETKDTEIEGKIGHVSKTVVTTTGYSYIADVYTDENISILWTSQTIRFRHKMSSSRYVTRTFWSPSYTQTTNSYLNPGTDYYPNLQTYDDSSFHATSYGQFAMVIQDRDYDQFAYKIEAYYDYYYTKIVVTRLK